MTEDRPSTEKQEEPVTITDKRKIKLDDDVTESAEEAASTEAVPSAEPEPDLLAERTADLQRLQAEYANYRKRAERDRLAAGEIAIARVLADFLPVLDNLDRARAHEDLTGGLKAVSDQLDDVFAKLGLQPFGEVGDPFDPEIHEAVMHDVSDEVTVPTCTTVMRPGYRHGERLLRPAMVGVSEPASTPAPEE